MQLPETTKSDADSMAVAAKIDGIDLPALAREIAARLAPEALLDAADVGALMKFAPRYVTEELQHLPGFPRSVRFSKESGGRTHPRWIRAHITDYILAQAAGREKKPGRPRKPLELP